jgi:hypothetical protein
MSTTQPASESSSVTSTTTSNDPPLTFLRIQYEESKQDVIVEEPVFKLTIDPLKLLQYKASSALRTLQTYLMGSSTRFYTDLNPELWSNMMISFYVDITHIRIRVDLDAFQKYNDNDFDFSAPWSRNGLYKPIKVKSRNVPNTSDKFPPRGPNPEKSARKWLMSLGQQIRNNAAVRQSVAVPSKGNRYCSVDCDHHIKFPPSFSSPLNLNFDDDLITIKNWALIPQDDDLGIFNFIYVPPNAHP